MAAIPPRPSKSGTAGYRGSRSAPRTANKAVLSGVLLDRSAEEAGLVAATEALLRDRGFDVLDTIEVFENVDAGRWSGDVGRPIPAPATLLVVVDVNPLRGELLRSQHPPGAMNNHRLDTLRGIEKVLRTGWGQLGIPRAEEPPTQNLLAWFEADRDGWPLIRRVVPERETTYRQTIAELEAWLIPPFPVVSELSEWGIASRTDLVEHGGALAVCKTFKHGRDEAFQNELRCYALADRVDVIPEPLLTGRNWVLVPYLADHQTLDRVYGSRVPVRLAKRCVEEYQRISDLGIALLDFGPKNVLVAPGGRVALIDFEHSFAYRDTRSRSPLETPFALGAKFFEAERQQLGPQRWLTDGFNVLKTYDRHWLPVTGVPLAKLIDGDPKVSAARQLAFFGRRAVTRRVGRLRARLSR